MNPKRTAVVAVILALAVVLAAALIADVRKLQVALTAYPVWRMAVACALVLGNYTLRTLRFRLYLTALPLRLPWLEAWLTFVAGFVATVSPGKMGEVFKGYLLNRRRGTPVADVAVVVVAERFTDVVGLLLLGTLALLAPGTGPMGGAYRGALALIVLLCLGFLVAVVHPTLVPRVLQGVQPRLTKPWLQKVWAIIAKTHGLLRRLCAPRWLLPGLALAMAAWLLEAVAFHYVLQGVDPSVGFPIAMAIYAVATLVGAVSMLPGGVGTTEAVMIALLTARPLGLHLDLGTATLCTLLIRFATLWFGVGMGALALTALRFLPEIAPSPGAESPSVRVESPSVRAGPKA